MPKKSVLLFGFPDHRDDDGDETMLRKAAAKGKQFKGWSCTKDIVAGDELWFYISKPVMAITSVGEAMSDAKPGDNWPFEVRVGNIRMIQVPITPVELRSEFPEWGWPRSPQGKVNLTPEQARFLKQRMRRKPPKKPPSDVRESILFGRDPEENRKVEKAAIRFVTKLYKKRGYRVTSCEAEKCGYDLIATKKGETELHLEVKGVSGNDPEFVITRNEVQAARDDKNFRLIVVTNTRSKPKALEMTGTEMIRYYELTPLAYRATQK